MTLPPTDHFNGKTFFNPGEPSDRGLLDLLKWKLTSRAVPWPERVEVPAALPPPPAADGIVATWVGHVDVRPRTPSAVDPHGPVFSERASPVPGSGPRRVGRPGVDFDAVPKVDLVLLSHDHYDHCDLPTLRRLARRDDPLVIAPLGHRALLAGAGLRRVVELDWWGAMPARRPRGDARPGAALEPPEALRDQPKRLWGGFMLRAGGRLVYFAGDSGYQEGLFPEIGRCGAPDLALLPIGAYEPRWFMKDAHMNPAEAVRAHRRSGPAGASRCTGAPSS
jgi:L-ascorbate metabolism protein UlaG (beta-lactamase superfamily)